MTPGCHPDFGAKAHSSNATVPHTHPEPYGVGVLVMPEEAHMALISAYRRDTGEKVTIPESWIGHPVLGAPFSKTPRQKAADSKAAKAAIKAPTTGDKED